LTIASGSFSTRISSIEGNYATTGSNVFMGAQTVCANITSTGTIIAQTINVQQVTSSIVYSSGSNIFGNLSSDIQQMTGSLRITGSLNTIGNACATSICSPTFVGGTMSGTTIHGSTVICGASICTTGNTCFGGMSIIASCLGIGTTSPSQLLHLQTTLASSSGVGTAIQIESGGAGSDIAWIGVNKGTGNGLEISIENRDIIFNTGAATPFGGSERMRITCAGKVAINDTTNLDSLFTVNTKCCTQYNAAAYLGNASNIRLINGSACIGAYSGISFGGGGSTEGFFGIVQNSTCLAEFVWQTFNGSAYGERMRIRSAGEVLIGSTGIYGGTDNNESRLLVVGNPPSTDVDRGLISFMDARAYNTSGLGAKVMLGGKYNTAGAITFFAGLAGLKENTTDGNYAGALAFYTRANGAASTERMRITSGGLVGIGTMAPNYRLEVQKTGVGAPAIFVNQCDSNEATIRFKSTHSCMSDYRIGASILVSNSFEITNHQCSYTNYLINCNGFSKFSHDGSFVNGNVTLYHSFDSNRGGGPIVYMYQRCSTGDGLLVNVQTCNTSYYTWRGYSNPYGDMSFIYSNGTFVSRTNTYGAIVSDVRCKTEIVDASSQWCDIKNLRVRNFKFIEDVENDPENALRQIGFIAQEVETVSPGLVFESSNGSENTGCWKNVKTSIIGIKSIKALQEAMCRIEILESCLGLT